MSSDGDFKNNNLRQIRFDSGEYRSYHTRRMAAGLSDWVDAVQLAEQGAVLRRLYAPEDMPRLEDLLASEQGVVHARMAFAKLPSGRPGARVEVRTELRLRCQRCMSGFVHEVTGASEIEFAADATEPAAGDEREIFRTEGGRISLKDLAEEEVLLALPMVPACTRPATCGNAVRSCGDPQHVGDADSMRRPFGELRELLTKPDRT